MNVSERATTQVLILDSNRLAELPEEIGSLTKLERLTAAQNALAALPGSFTALKSLAVLRLSKNKFSSIPEHLNACTALEEIDFSDTYLQVRHFTHLTLACLHVPYFPQHLLSLHDRKHRTAKMMLDRHSVTRVCILRE